MNTIITNVMNNVNIHIYLATQDAMEFATSVHHQAENNFAMVKAKTGEAYQAVSQSLVDGAAKTKNFVLDHKETILFIGCCCATAYFAPTLFFPTAVAVIIIRVEAAHHLKKLANHFMKDERNPYLLRPEYGPNYISTLEITMAVIGAVDAIALGTIYMASSSVVVFIPILGGIAAGSYLAKHGMDVAHRFSGINLDMLNDYIPF